MSEGDRWVYRWRGNECICGHEYVCLHKFFWLEPTLDSRQDEKPDSEFFGNPVCPKCGRCPEGVGHSHWWLSNWNPLGTGVPYDEERVT